MMGRLKSDQGQLFYEFHLGDAIPEAIWCGRSTLLSIFPGFAANLHLIIHPWVARRSIRPLLPVVASDIRPGGK
jgi:hypothetical protein